MKRALFITGLLATVGCQRDKTPVIPEEESVNVSFRVGVEERTKAIGDGTARYGTVRNGTARNGTAPYGIYWSSSVSPDNPRGALMVFFNSGEVDRSGNLRFGGLSVRPVND